MQPPHGRRLWLEICPTIQMTSSVIKPSQISVKTPAAIAIVSTRQIPIMTVNRPNRARWKSILHRYFFAVFIRSRNAYNVYLSCKLRVVAGWSLDIFNSIFCSVKRFIALPLLYNTRLIQFLLHSSVINNISFHSAAYDAFQHFFRNYLSKVENVLYKIRK